MDESSPPTDSTHRGKVATLIEGYGLPESFGGRLETLWTRTENRRSLRDLADIFNKRLLAAALSAEGVSTVDGEVENLYRLLTDENVSSGARTEARARLEQDGIDVDRIERDFVTYQAIRTFLREERGAEYEPATEPDGIESVENTVKRLQSRVRSVVDGSLNRLIETDRITLGEFHLFVSIEVLCSDCGKQFSVVNLLERGGCRCDSGVSEGE